MRHSISLPASNGTSVSRFEAPEPPRVLAEL